MRRRELVAGLGLLSGCRRNEGHSIEGRWEGKLTNGVSSLTINYDFVPAPGPSFEFRVSCRDLCLVSQPIQAWKIEGSEFIFTLPRLEGPRTYAGRFGGLTFDAENKTAGESMHLRRLGRIPGAPYRETGLVDMIPTQRSSRATAQMFGKNEILLHFNADLLARLGTTTSSRPAPGAGWVFVEDLPLPPPPKENAPAFLIALSPSQARIAEIARYQCPIFVLLGEADTRNSDLERGTRQIAFDLRENLTKQGRKDYQISLIPKADQTFRIPGYGKEYPRLSPSHIEPFRKFLARFEPVHQSA